MLRLKLHTKCWHCVLVNLGDVKKENLKIFVIFCTSVNRVDTVHNFPLSENKQNEKIEIIVQFVKNVMLKNCELSHQFCLECQCDEIRVCEMKIKGHKFDRSRNVVLTVLLNIKCNDYMQSL